MKQATRDGDVFLCSVTDTAFQLTTSNWQLTTEPPSNGPKYDCETSLAPCLCPRRRGGRRAGATVRVAGLSGQDRGEVGRRHLQEDDARRQGRPACRDV